jgi:hypothetical protein
MTKIRRLEAQDATIGGVLFEFPSGKCKSAQWQSPIRVTDTLELAKKTTVHVLNALISEGAQDDVDRTNWTSCVAAVQKHIVDWNGLHPASRIVQ